MSLFCSGLLILEKVLSCIRLLLVTKHDIVSYSRSHASLLLDFAGGFAILHVTILEIAAREFHVQQPFRWSWILENMPSVAFMTKIMNRTMI